MAEPSIKRRKLSDYRPAEINPNMGSETGLQIIEDSLHQNGAGRSLLVDRDGEAIAGSHTLQAAINAGIEDVIEVETTGQELVIVRRSDLSLKDDARAKALQIVDNEATRKGYVPDKAIIGALLAEIATDDPALLRGTGMRMQEIRALLDELPDTEAGDNPFAALTRADVPDAVFPSDNEWGVPTLDATMQAEYIEAPFTAWGMVSRNRSIRGMIHFYVDDYRFNAVWDDPTTVVRTGARVIVEPNYSVFAEMPAAVALWSIYRKRWLARYWQTMGMRVLVDLNVPDPHFRLNWLGVPKGWKAYATRGYNHETAGIVDEYEAAREHAGTEPLFVVYGGGKDVKALCAERGWMHITEQQEEAVTKN